MQPFCWACAFVTPFFFPIWFSFFRATNYWLTLYTVSGRNGYEKQKKASLFLLSLFMKFVMDYVIGCYLFLSSSEARCGNLHRDER